MRLITRDDTSLALGLIIGAIVLFRQPLRLLLDAASQIEAEYHFDLIPALTILCVVFVFHQSRKQQLARAEARAAAAEAAQARARAAELERLVAFSQALANALEVETLRRALWRFLPAFAGERPCWVLARQGLQWQPVTIDAPPGDAPPLETLQAVADAVTAGDGDAAAPAGGILHGGTLCFPMRVQNALVGVLGVGGGSGLAHEDRAAVGAAAALIGVALKNVDAFGQSREHSMHDGLTGCFNRDYAFASLDNELRRAKRSGEPLSIIMFDVDHFKAINDELGHLHGDQVLRALGAQLTHVLRSTDIACRYGGDEFLIILPSTRLAGAEQVAGNLRQEVGKLAAAGPRRPITLSLGVTTAVPQELDVKAVIARADEALYQAKHAGRDRAATVVAAESIAPARPPAPGPAPAPTAAARGSRASILVVDDDPVVLGMVRRTLEPLGYDILEAGTGAEAIAVYDAHGAAVRLLLADVILPNLQGPEVVRQIRHRRSDIKVVFMSGFPGFESDELLERYPGAVFVAKPFTGETLAATVHEQLGDEAPAAS